MSFLPQHCFAASNSVLPVWDSAFAYRDKMEGQKPVELPV